MSNLLHAEVFNKKVGVSGKVINVGPDVVTVEFMQNGEKAVTEVTHGTFKRWYNVISNVDDSDLKPSNGMELRNRFMQILKSEYGEGIEVIFKPQKDVEIVKYNGKNIFEVSYTKKTLNVLCHPNSLAPQNKAKAYRIFPKEWNWSLRAKFIFTSLSEQTLMRSIIVDGIYYRKNKNLEEE